MNQAEAISRNASRWPAAPALESRDRLWTYSELDDVVRRAASWLRQRGVTRDMLVAVCLKDTASHVVVMLALARIGAVILPVDWRSRPDERARLFDAFDPQVALVETGAAPSRDDRKTIRVGDDWLDETSTMPPDCGETPEGGAPFLFNLSSGTTSTARAVMFTHDQFQAWLDGYLTGLGSDGRERYLSTLPLSFTAGRNRVFLYLNAGGTVVMGPSIFSTEELVETINGRGATAILLIPPVLRRVVEFASQPGVLLPGLRILESGADKLTADEKHTIVARLTPNLFETYANSAIGQISCLRPEDLADHADSVGRPNPLIQLEIVDNDDHRVPQGDVGALRCRGPSMTGTEDPINIRGGWLYPGDHGMIDDDGFLILKGRATTVIKRGGTSIYPEEIEPVLTGHPAVTEAAIVGRPDGAAGDAIVAFVVAPEGFSLEAFEDYLDGALSGYKRPQEIVVTDGLPLTGSGKVDRAALIERAAAHASGDG